MSELPKATVARMMKNSGALRVGKQSVEMLADAMVDYGTEITEKANLYARHSGRKTIKPADVKLALK